MTAAAAPETEPAAPAAAILRGTARGLEIVIDDSATSRAAIVAAVAARLAEAPTFFKGSDVRVRTNVKLPAGTLAALDELAGTYDLAIVEVGAATKPRTLAAVAPIAADAIPEPQLALGSAPTPPSPELVVEVAPAPTPAPAPVVVETAADAADDEHADAVRVVVGPVRSGVILEHPGHLIIFGDVNPGAEVRALGNIAVLGRLRGTAHAGLGGTDSFIMAHRLEPQQLRIGRRVTRAGENERPGTEPELAHVVGDHITVERFTGKLPRNLAASLASL